MKRGFAPFKRVFDHLIVNQMAVRDVLSPVHEDNMHHLGDLEKLDRCREQQMRLRRSTLGAIGIGPANGEVLDI